MKRTLLAAALCTLAASCTASSKNINDHWTDSSVAPRMGRFFLGYDGSVDGDYRDFAWERKKDITLTLRRHFLNQNPDNPNLPDWEGRYAGRPYPHSLFPNPVPYIHLEGVVIGLIPYLATGTFVPIPVDSILATLEPGGIDEFVEGVEWTFTPLGVATASVLTEITPGTEPYDPTATMTRVEAYHQP